MPVVSNRAQLRLSQGEVEMLTALSQSRTEAAGRVRGPAILLRYHASDTVSEIARSLGTNRPRVERCVSKALELGVSQALADLPGRGRRPVMTPEARAWVVSLACQKPKGLGYAQELWAALLLAQHIRKQSMAAGIRVSPGWGEERFPRSSALTRCSHTGFSTTWSDATRSSTPRWCRCCMYTGKWRSGARKAHRLRIWWQCSPPMRNPEFKPPGKPRPIFRP